MFRYSTQASVARALTSGVLSVSAEPLYTNRKRGCSRPRTATATPLTLSNGSQLSFGLTGWHRIKWRWPCTRIRIGDPKASPLCIRASGRSSARGSDPRSVADTRPYGLCVTDRSRTGSLGTSRSRRDRRAVGGSISHPRSENRHHWGSSFSELAPDARYRQIMSSLRLPLRQ